MEADRLCEEFKAAAMSGKNARFYPMKIVTDQNCSFFLVLTAEGGWLPDVNEVDEHEQQQNIDSNCEGGTMIPSRRDVRSVAMPSLLLALQVTTHTFSLIYCGGFLFSQICIYIFFTS